MAARPKLPSSILLASLTIPGVVLLGALSWAPAASAQSAPFVCNGEAYIVQGDHGLLSRVDQSMTPDFTFITVGEAGAALNAIGFRSTDGLLYGMTSDPPYELATVDADAVLTRLGLPAMVPAQVYNAGTVSIDGSTYFISDGGGDGPLGNPNLYSIDLTDPAFSVTVIPIFFDGPGGNGVTLLTGNVADLAFNPVDETLYGADDDGDIAKIRFAGPDAGRRTDWRVNSVNPENFGDPLPSGDFGATWFDADGTLFVYENSGLVYAVDPIAETWTGPTMGPGSDRNDGTACATAVIGVAKEMSDPVQVAPPNDFPVDVVITYTFENFSARQDLFLVSAVDDLIGTFGPSTDWSVLNISSSQASFHNPAFDGELNTELINNTPTQIVATTSVVTITVTVRVTDNSLWLTEYCNQVEITGNADPAGAGIIFGDLSTDGLDPDPDGDGSPTENQPSCVDAPHLPPTEIPTLAGWGMALLMLLLAGGGFFVLRRGRSL